MVKDSSKIESICLFPDSSLSEAIKVIDLGGVQACLVVDESGRLEGILLDGDVRRALLRGHSMDALVRDLMNTDFRFMRAPASPAAAEEFMTRNKIRHIPILNDSGKIENFFTIDKYLFKAELSVPALIMAGGLGMRLRPLTDTTPKPMLSVGKMPLLERVIGQCVAAGLSDIYLSVNYRADQIMDYFGDGSQWGLTIEYLEETDALGTAGALGLLPPELNEVVVLNGDVLARVDLRRMVEFHREHFTTATVALREFIIEVPYGLVSLEGTDVLDIQEKPSLRHFVNAGIYVLRREVIDLVLGSRAIDMPDLILEAINKGHSVRGFPVYEDWIDVGTFESLTKARENYE